MRRLTYSNVTATLALIFAMSGGAMAATGFKITSTSQISPSVRAALKGQQGPEGKEGPQGRMSFIAPQTFNVTQVIREPFPVQGPEGPQGKEGPKGTPGLTPAEIEARINTDILELKEKGILH